MVDPGFTKRKTRSGDSRDQVLRGSTRCFAEIPGKLFHLRPMRYFAFIGVIGIVLAFSCTSTVTGQEEVLTPISFSAKAVKSGSRNVRIRGQSWTKKILVSGKAVEVDVRFTEKIKSPYQVEVFFIARYEASGEQWIYDASVANITEQFDTVTLESIPLRGKETQSASFTVRLTDGRTARLDIEKAIAGDKINGWIVRCRSGNTIVAREASSKPLLDLSYEIEDYLDEVIREVVPDAKAVDRNVPMGQPPARPKNHQKPVKAFPKEFNVFTQYSGQEGFREYSDLVGRKILARVLATSQEKVILELQSGVTSTIGKEELSVADREYLESWPVTGSVPGEIRTFGEIEFAWCPPCEEGFLMGSPENEVGRTPFETLHRVRLTSGFWIAKFEITQGQWEALMDTDLSQQQQLSGGKQHYGQGKDFPMYYVNWIDAMAFCDALSEEHELPETWYFTIPTEAQWEYACRAGTRTVFSFGDKLTSSQANFNGRQPYGTEKVDTNLGQACPVGSYEPNSWGIFDMHGNVWEWTFDRFGPDFYSEGQIDPVGELSPDDIDIGDTIRGGSWMGGGGAVRAAKRYQYSPMKRGQNIGIRVIITNQTRNRKP